MSDATKRLDLQFGSFACSVQGFDDPVQPVLQVLQALQNLLEETPELGDSGISFDSEAIERLIGEVARRADLDEADIEIVPGLIIVHRRGDTARELPRVDDGAFDDIKAGLANFRRNGGEDADSNREWMPLRDAGEKADANVAEDPLELVRRQDADDADPGYVNIFTPKSNSGGEAKAKPGFNLFQSAADDDSDPVGDDDEDVLELLEDPFATRLGKMTTPDPDDEGTGRDIFAESGSGVGGSVFADPMSEPGEPPAGGEGAGINFFTGSGARDRDSEGAGKSAGGPAGLFASGPTEEPDGEGDNSERGEALFGQTDDQPEIDEADEGYTAASIAKTAGANSIAELMVSAAAWMVLIRGRTTFTRNEVVEAFEAMPGDHDKTPEARVRGFGKAVRDGHFVMVEEGVFGLSRPELERFQRLL